VQIAIKETEVRARASKTPGSIDLAGAGAVDGDGVEDASKGEEGDGSDKTEGVGTVEKKKKMEPLTVDKVVKIVKKALKAMSAKPGLIDAFDGRVIDYLRALPPPVIARCGARV
jgi:hypothetical protein